MKKSIGFIGAIMLLAAPAAMAKVEICHIPPGNPANAHTISVGDAAVPAHVANHGDVPCSCEAVADCAERDGELDLETCECEVKREFCGDAVCQDSEFDRCACDADCDDILDYIYACLY